MHSYVQKENYIFHLRTVSHSDGGKDLRNLFKRALKKIKGTCKMSQKPISFYCHFNYSTSEMKLGLWCYKEQHRAITGPNTSEPFPRWPEAEERV